MKKASITLYLSLMLSLICGLICTTILSAKIMAARVLAISAMDQSLYSLMAEYDRAMLEAFDVFVLDAGYESSAFRAEIINSKLKDYQKTILSPEKSNVLWGGGLLSIERSGGGISGYALASDGGGRVLKGQIIHAVKDTYLQEKVKGLLKESRAVEDLLSKNKGQSSDQALMDYDTLKEEAAQRQEEEALKEEMSEAVNFGEESLEEDDGNEEKIEVPADFKNPIESVAKIKSDGVLPLVLENVAEVSGGILNDKLLFSKRNLASGMGSYAINEDVDSTVSDLLYQEYLLGRFKGYTDKGKEKFRYQLEYLIGGKTEDRENLKAVVNELLLIREAANLAYLYSDGEKRQEAEAFARLIASSIGFPALSPALELVLLACWAFGESILDVKELLAGGNIPLMKEKSTWNLSLENLANVEETKTKKKNKEGLSYKEYLRILLLKENQEDVLFRSMDLMEERMRNEYKKENFRLDNSLVYIEGFMSIKSEGKKVYEVVRGYGYDM